MNGLHNILKNNKYSKWYVELVSKERKLISTYVEHHHIIPKSCGGSNDKDNIIVLSAREHYIAHLLLVKAVKSPFYYKMLCAFTAMSMKSKSTYERYHKINSVIYENLKKKRAKIVSVKMKEFFSYEKNRKLHSIKIKDSWTEERKIAHSNHLKKHSPFKNKEIHKKTMNTRKERGTNVFEFNNPMHNNESIAKKVAKTSGNNHYTRKKLSYFLKTKDDRIRLDISDGMFKVYEFLGISSSYFYTILKKNIAIPKGNYKGCYIERIYEN